MKRKLIYLILSAFLASAAMAQDVSVRADHPDEYVVVRGDTLWDISGKFLEHPWQWPAIWHANQQIENPHLIYPGDVLSLVYIDGQPRLQVDRGKPQVRLSPEARVTDRSAVGPVAHESISGLLRNIRLVSMEELEALPYVVKNYEQRHAATHTDRTYVRGLDGELGGYYAIMRPANIYYKKKDGVIRRAREPGYGQHAPTDHEWHPGFWEGISNYPRNFGDVVGVELYEVALARLDKHGDPAILTISNGLDFVKEGDLVLPLDDMGYEEMYQPRAMDSVPSGARVLAVQNDNKLTGHLKMVSISGGSAQGVQPGHVFSAFTPGETVRDRVKYPATSLEDARTWNGDKVTLPDEFNGHIMVFRVFDEISYALIMEGERPVFEDDVLKHPSETL